MQTRLESMLNEAERRALVKVLRSKPDITLENLQSCFKGKYGAILRSITVRELLESEFALTQDGGPPIDPLRLEEAKRLNGEPYDRCVLEAILTAGGRAVSAGYLRPRVGGPRWKLQASLRRLVDAGHLERSGVTSSTRYRPLYSQPPAAERLRQPPAAERLRQPPAAERLRQPPAAERLRQPPAADSMSPN